MAGKDDKDLLLDETLESLGDGGGLPDEDQERLAQLAERIEEPGLQDRILERYLQFGKRLLGDQLPSRVDPRIAKTLEPILGDVSNVRVHTGEVATSAARAMNARAFAIGDQDVFIDSAQFRAGSAEGGQLLAHELAHTRDAATGFALSSNIGMHTSDREQFAHSVELQFAREWEDRGDTPQREDDEPAPQVTHSGMPAEPEVDKNRLLDKIVEIMERQERVHAERHGLG